MTEPGIRSSTTSLRFPRPPGRTWARVEAVGMIARVVLNGAEVARIDIPWIPFEVEITDRLHDRNLLEIACDGEPHPCQGFLPAIGHAWCGARDLRILDAPTPERSPARPRVEARGTRLLVDGRPFRVRGILHWGHYPEIGRPWPSERQMRREIRDLRERGFNLVKFCLWIPPRRYYELCEEEGMFVWQEYPVWHEPLHSRSHRRAFEAFFRNDAPYSCILLRTLTCENDRVDAATARELVDLAHEMIPGCLVLDNNSWISNERSGDFHDEHPYLHNAQWEHFGPRMSALDLEKPLLLGETMCVDDPGEERSARTAIAVRRHQIETLARDLPDVGYVVCALRDLEHAPLGLFTRDGHPKTPPEMWSWHRDPSDEPTPIPAPSGPVPGPAKGAWKCREFVWWSPLVRVLDPDLPEELILDEAMFELLSGRVLTHAAGTRVLVEVVDIHDRSPDRAVHHPLVIEFETEGERRIVSAFRDDTPAGRELRDHLASRRGSAPEIGPLTGSAVVLREWEMSRDDATWSPVVCDTPLVNRGRNVFEGWATFRTRFRHDGGPTILRCEAVGDFYEIELDGRPVGEAGNRTGTWDGTRDVPRDFPLEPAPGEHELVFRVRDWRAAGGMVGPVYLASDLEERLF